MRNQYSIITFVAISLLIILINILHLPNLFLAYDVFGYYLHLPAFFIFQDIALSDIAPVEHIVNTYGNTPSLYQLVLLENGNHINIYQVGIAILYLPFFLIGHLIALNSNYAADGFSLPYQYSVFIGSVIYTIVGLWFFRKLFVKLFSDKIASLLLIIVVLGTNYLLHVSVHAQNMMTHNYLFTLYAIFIYYTYKWHIQQKWTYILIMALTSGLLILSRPSEIVVFIIPILWNVTNWNTFISKLRFLYTKKKQLIFFSIIVVLLLSIQLIYNYVCIGSIFYSSYNNLAGDRLEPLNPHFVNVLFSFRKGWLIYTPIMVFSLIGFYHLYKYYTKWFWVSLVFFIANLYIVSSWSCWWYAESFSQRALIQSYVVMSIPLGAFVSRVRYFKTPVKLSAIFLIIAFISLNLFQSWQASKGIIHGSRMTAKYYFKVLGSTQLNVEDESYLLINREIIDETIEFDTLKYKYKSSFEWDFKEEDNSIETKGMLLDATQAFSSPVSIRFKEITNNDHAWLKVSAYIYPKDSIILDQAFIVMHFQQKDKSIKYRTVDIALKPLLLNEWNYVEAYYLTAEVTSSSAIFKTYIWNRAMKTFKVDRLKVEVFDVEETN